LTADVRWISIEPQHICCILEGMNSDQARRFLARQGCTFESGKGGHLLVRRGNRTSVLPQHGGKTQLGKGLWLKILKDLGLRER
jgi:mRNA interferase HicA